jgi:hypothetical protein
MLRRQAGLKGWDPKWPHYELNCPSERRLCDADRSKSLVHSSTDRITRSEVFGTSERAADTDEMVVSVIDQVVHSMAVELSRVTALMETVGPVADLSGFPSGSCTWKPHATRA